MQTIVKQSKVVINDFLKKQIKNRRIRNQKIPRNLVFWVQMVKQINHKMKYLSHKHFQLDRYSLKLKTIKI